MKNQEHIIEIVNGCVQNDKTCQFKLFNMFHSKMINVCARYTLNEHQAQDIVQLSFIKVFNKISQYSPKKSIEGWIRKIVINTALDEIRKDKFRNSTTTIDVSFLELKETEYSEDNLNLILDTVNKLPPTYKTIFEMHVLQNYPHKEIAEILGIHEGTSKSSLFKAKAKLRNELKNKIYGHN
jgi:RNA polymerase sigma-70 factor (ECF subfamily)